MSHYDEQRKTWWDKLQSERRIGNKETSVSEIRELIKKLLQEKQDENK